MREANLVLSPKTETPNAQSTLNPKRALNLGHPKPFASGLLHL